MKNDDRIVITGVGLTSPNGDTLEAYRRNLLTGVSGVSTIETRFMGRVLAGVCRFDEHKYQSKKDRRRGTRAGAISIYCAHEAFQHARIEPQSIDRSRVGTFIGITEHGTVETENEIDVIRQYGYDTKYWSHHHNPRTVANNPAGEVTVNLGLSGPHYTIGAACAADDRPARHIARWDGVRWSALNTGTSDAVSALAVYDDGTGPALFVGGSFTTAGAENAAYIARWSRPVPPCPEGP
jgi:3-oxoacyl-[acyl-carrier-protein] synthase II